MKKEKSKAWLEFRQNFRQNAPAMLKALLAHMGAWCKRNFAMEPRKVLEIFKNGLVLQNPVLVALMGLCSAVAVTATLKDAVCMSICTTAVLVLTNLVVSLLRRWTPKQVRGACYVVVAGSFVTIADMVLKASFPEFSQRLGIFVPLIVVNCIVLSRADTFASRHTPGYAIVDGLAVGAGYTLAMALLGAIRELLGSGTLWGAAVLGEKFQPAMLIAAPCGGFLVLGVLTALAQWLRSLGERRRKA